MMKKKTIKFTPEDEAAEDIFAIELKTHETEFGTELYC